MTRHATRQDTGQAFTARLRFVTIKTDDLNTSLGFYERILGFPRTRTAADFVLLDAGGAETLRIGGRQDSQPQKSAPQ